MYIWSLAPAPYIYINSLYICMIWCNILAFSVAVPVPCFIFFLFGGEFPSPFEVEEEHVILFCELKWKQNHEFIMLILSFSSCSV